MTKIDFQGFPGLDFGLLKFHDFPGFPGPVRTLGLGWFRLYILVPGFWPEWRPGVLRRP